MTALSSQSFSAIQNEQHARYYSSSKRLSEEPVAKKSRNEPNTVPKKAASAQNERRDYSTPKKLAATQKSMNRISPSDKPAKKVKKGKRKSKIIDKSEDEFEGDDDKEDDDYCDDEQANSPSGSS